MTPAQLEKALLEYTKGLPKEAMREILDFVQLIRQRGMKNRNSIRAELTRLNQSQAAHLEKEFKDYRKLYPLE